MLRLFSAVVHDYLHCLTVKRNMIIIRIDTRAHFICPSKCSMCKQLVTEVLVNVLCLQLVNEDLVNTLRKSGLETPIGL